MGLVCVWSAGLIELISLNLGGCGRTLLCHIERAPVCQLQPQQRPGHTTECCPIQPGRSSYRGLAIFPYVTCLSNC